LGKFRKKKISDFFFIFLFNKKSQNFKKVQKNQQNLFSRASFISQSVTREGGLSGDSCNRLDSWAPLFVPAAPQEREEKKKKTKKFAANKSLID
jgi:hypothetical protein